MVNVLIKKVEKEHQDYLRDESRKVGNAESISFPKNEFEIIDILESLKINKTLVTLQGARTGIAAGAVPNGGHILNLIRMNKVLGLRYDDRLDTFFLRVQPGALLSEIKEMLKKREFDTENWSKESLDALERLKSSQTYFFSPDPTETTASIGGMAACNASGACSFKYGPTRNHIQEIRVILIDGSTVTLKRERDISNKGIFSIKTDSGKTINGTIPKYHMPQVKNASGYYVKQDMDLLDLFIGSDGTLGIISEMELKLLKEPKSIYGITAFFNNEEDSLEFIEKFRENSLPAAVEFFNHNALDLLRKERQVNPAFSKLLELPLHFHTAVYIEYHGDSQEEIINMVMNTGDAIESCGGSEKDTWVATNPQAMDQLKFFRHAVPEAVNLLIDERRKADTRLTKLGTDMAVPNLKLKEIMNLYNSTLKDYNLESVIFGHIGNNHLHVNIIPRNIDDYTKGKELYNNWAEEVINVGGTVSAEHGIGKLKTLLLGKMMGEQGIKEMKALKKLFDPENRLNRGNLFEE